MINVDVVSEEKNWSKKLRNKEFFFYSICKSFPKKYQFLNKKIYFTLLLSNNRGIKKLNFQFRNKKKPTDVRGSRLEKSICTSTLDLQDREVYFWVPCFLFNIF